MTIANAPSPTPLGCKTLNRYKQLPQFLCSPLTAWRSPVSVLHSLVMNVHQGGPQTTQIKLPQSAAGQPQVPMLPKHLLLTLPMSPSTEPRQETPPKAWDPTQASSCRPWPYPTPATASTWSGWRCLVTLFSSMPSPHTCSVPTPTPTREDSATCAARRWDGSWCVIRPMEHHKWNDDCDQNCNFQDVLFLLRMLKWTWIHYEKGYVSHSVNCMLACNLYIYFLRPQLILFCLPMPRWATVTCTVWGRRRGFPAGWWCPSSTPLLTGCHLATWSTRTRAAQTNWIQRRSVNFLLLFNFILQCVCVWWNCTPELAEVFVRVRPRI